MKISVFVTGEYAVHDMAASVAYHSGVSNHAAAFHVAESWPLVVDEGGLCDPMIGLAATADRRQ